MKFLVNFTLFFVVSISLSLGQAAETCNSSNKNFENLVSVSDAARNCDEVNRSASCSESKIDPNAVRAMITTQVEQTMSPEFMRKAKNDFRDWDRYFNLNPFFSRFYHYDESEKSRNQDPTPILNWINDREFSSQTVDAAALKQSFIDKYVDFAKKMDCTPQIKSEDFPRELDVPKAVVSTGKQRAEYDLAVEDFKTESNKPEIAAAVKAEIARFNQLASDTLTTCSDKLWEPREYHTVAHKFPACAGNFKEYFADNAFKISQSSLGQIMADENAKDLVACIKERTAQGAKINHITISASSSSLNNGGEAAKKFCEKGFKQLSEARAQSAKEAILPAVFQGTGLELERFNEKVRTSTDGSNGNGTSGPCVYKRDQQGHEVLKPEVLKALALADRKKKNPAVRIDTESQAVIDSMESAKFVSVQVTFDENAVGAKEQQKGYASRVSCRRLRFTCPSAATAQY